MFDFGSGHRNEGDVLGVNTKGLVGFDHRTRKDAFFFYKANWSSERVTYEIFPSGSPKQETAAANRVSAPCHPARRERASPAGRLLCLERSR
jgi:hypothetical protein